MSSDAQSTAVQQFLQEYGRSSHELLPADQLSSPGNFSGEEEFIDFADRDYQTDRHWAFEIKPEECALVVVDLQEDFVNPGNPMCVPEAYRQIPRVLALIEGCREAGVPVPDSIEFKVVPKPPIELEMVAGDFPYAPVAPIVTEIDGR